MLFRSLLTDVYDSNGGKADMDSAFARAEYDFIFKSGKEVWFDLREHVAWQNQQATFAWQYAEWGMHVLQ